MPSRSSRTTRRRPAAGTDPAADLASAGGALPGGGPWSGGGASLDGGPWSGAGQLSGADQGPDADPEAVARLICLRLLTAAPRTRAQLADALKCRGVPTEAAEAVLSRFTEVGLIDDSMFASMWVETRHRGRGLGHRALAAELERRGVASEDIAVAVEQLTPDMERAAALALVERRLASIAGQPRQVQARKLAGLLARKGYSAGLAYGVVREALDRAGAAAGDGDFPDEDEFAAEDHLDASA